MAAAAGQQGGQQQQQQQQPPLSSSSSSSQSLPRPTPPAPTASNVVASTSSSAPGPATPSRPPTLQLRRSSGGAASSSSSNNNATATGARLTRRVTTQERLDGILELARQRAESMSPGQSPPVFRSPLYRSSGGTGGGATPPTSRSPFFREPDVDGAQDATTPTPPEPDETTGIVMAAAAPRQRGASPAINYQSMAPMDGTSGTRARKNGAAAPRSNTGRRRENTGSGGGGGGDEAHGDEDGAERNKEAEAWWKTQLAKFGSIELENKGSVARDHLALERTFLAWLRTSLSFASIGVAITQLFRLNTSLSDGAGAGVDSTSVDSASSHTLRHLGKPLGGIFLGISILMLFLGYHRYFQAQQWIIKGKFPASRGTVILVSLVALCLMIISLVVVLLVQPAETGS